MNKISRKLSLFLAVLVMIMAMPIVEIISYAEVAKIEKPKPRVREINVNKVYENINEDGQLYYMDVVGTDLMHEGKLNMTVGVRGSDGKINAFEPISQTENIVQYEISPYDLGQTIYVGGAPINISITNMPTLSGRNPSTGTIQQEKIDEYEKINIEGSNFDKIKDNIKGYLYQQNNLEELPSSSGNTIDVKDNLNNKSGTWGVLFSQKSKPKLDIALAEDKTIDLSIEHRYLNVFNVYRKLDVGDTLDISPTRGPLKTQVEITSEKLPKENEMNVFFIKSLAERLTVKHMSKFESHRVEGGKHIFTAEVPESLKEAYPGDSRHLGEYFVILTNNVKEGVDPSKAVTSREVLEQKFLVIDNKDSMKLIRIEPERDTALGGTTANISGRYIGSMSGNVHTPKGEYTLTREGERLIVDYEEGGIYTQLGTDTEGKFIEYKSLKREIGITIGSPVKFKEFDQSKEDDPNTPIINPQGYDELKIIIPSTTDLENPVKDVIAHVKTTIVYMDKDEEGKEVEKTVTFDEEDIIRNGFTYLPIDYEPEIMEVIPSKIPVTSAGEVTPEGIELNIYGKDFVVHKYKDKDGKEKLKYPVIDLGNGELILNRNLDKDIDIKVYNERGTELDGTELNNRGTRIKVTIPDGTIISKDKINKREIIRVTNPLLNSEEIELVGGNLTNMGANDIDEIMFVSVKQDEKPIITKIIPDVITIEGKNDIVIEGSGFDKNVKLYLDGEEVKNFTRESPNKIIFDAPPKLAGKYQIILQNESGAIAKSSILYVKTYTNIKLTDFNPKIGTENTKVVIKGEGFVKTIDNKVTDISSEEGMNKLLGTKVYLDGVDVNEYNYVDGKVAPKEYEAAEDLFSIKEVSGHKKIEASEIYHSLILKEGKDNYYTIQFDIKDGKYKISDSVNEYAIDISKDKIIGEIDGVAEEVVINKDSIKIGDKTFKFLTPYKFDNTTKEITGNRVKVVSENEIIFTVPKKQDDRKYDLKVENPDTMSDEKTGEDGFHYKLEPNYELKIESINPDRGSVNGGYYITIKTVKGKEFFQGFHENADIYIGGQRVNREDLELDETGYVMRVKVPPYDGDLSKEIEISERTVSVIVVNPDGASDSWEYGFTYVLGTSSPVIEDLSPDNGSIMGGEGVKISGYDFRFFEPEEPNLIDLNGNGVRDDLRLGYVNVFDENGGLVKKDLVDLDDEEWEQYVVPILPKIYFGSREAVIQKKARYESDIIEVVTPPNAEGPTDVYIINNDTGQSEKVKYLYVGHRPIVDYVSPDGASRNGGTKINVKGRDFIAKDINMITDKNIAVPKTMQLVQFGGLNDVNMSNGSIKDPRAENFGKIDRGKSKVRVGNLTVEFEEDIFGKKQLKFELRKVIDNKVVVYRSEYDKFEKEIFLRADALKNENERCEDNELIKISLEPEKEGSAFNRLRVDRGYSTNVITEDEGYVIAESPTYYSFGTTGIRVENPDGTKSLDKSFEFLSYDTTKPVITEIVKSLGDQEQKGYEEDGRVIVELTQGRPNDFIIKGRNFHNPTLSIGMGDNKIDIPKQYYEVTKTRIKVSLPRDFFSVDDVNFMERIYLENEDKGATHSNEYYIKVGMPGGVVIESIKPNQGPSTGGTEVTITGKGFRPNKNDGEELVVLFDGNKAEIITVEEPREIIVKTPPNNSGWVDVTVRIMKKGLVKEYDTVERGFNYTSAPTITSVVRNENEAEKIEKISVKGGEIIRLKGTDFLPGAKVIFKPKLRKLNEGEFEENLGNDETLVVIKGNKYVLKYDRDDEREDDENANLQELIKDFKSVDEKDRHKNGFAKVVDKENIVVTTPEGKIGDKGILVINPDGGVSNVYNLEYGIPEIGAPFDVRADLVYDQFIRVSWEGVENALEYEVYISKDGGGFEFVGSTKANTFVYQDIEPHTKYQFLVRAIGQYGQSKPIDESKSNIIKTGRVVGPEDTDGPLGEKTEVNREGDNVDVIIGSKDFGLEGLTIDMTRGELAGTKNLTIRMPASVISQYMTGPINIISGEYTMNLTPKSFRSDRMLKNSGNEKAGVVFKVTPYNGELGAKATDRMMAGPRYQLEAISFIDKEKVKVDRLSEGINLNLSKNNMLIQSRKLQDVGLSRYFYDGNRWIKTANVDRMTIYTVTGSRR